MIVSAEDAPGMAAVAQGRRAGRELVLEWAFRPASRLLVPSLLRVGMPPPAVVVANAVAGILAAFAIARGSLIAGALLLQLKTLLDNTDGQLARAAGRVTLAGRYLDSLADLVVNAALFVALAHATGRPWLALAAFLALTLTLSVDFNLSEIARAAHDDEVSPPSSTGSAAESALVRAYALAYGPQDRLVRGLSERRFRRAVGAAPPERRATAWRAYHDSATLTVFANLGLSTQLLVLGACLALDAPELYLWIVLACVPLVAVLQLRRELLVRRVVAG